MGKTTLVNKIITHLNNLQIEFDGFLTEEIRNERFQRTGFSVRLIKTNATTILADKRSVIKYYQACSHTDIFLCPPKSFS